jgi:hypothetical protein
MRIDTPTLNGVVTFESGASFTFNGTTAADFLEAIGGGTGSGSSYALQHAYTAGVDYCGKAPENSLTSASVWNITKIVIASAGTVTITHAIDVKWDDYLTVIYT